MHEINEMAALLKYLLLSMALFGATASHSQMIGLRTYPNDGYAIEVPASWEDKIPPDSNIRQFLDKSGKVYCSVETQAIDAVRMPQLAGLNESEIRHFMTQPWIISDWLQVYPGLASAANFKVFNIFP